MNKKEFTYIGKSFPRIDALEKVTGKAIYINDLFLPGMLYGKMVLSGVPHALIKKIDLSEAKKIPGVIAILTADDIPGENQVGLVLPDQPLLAVEKVRYVGECVALIAGESQEVCEEAKEKIKIEYEELPGVFSVDEGLKKDAPQLHKDRKGNIAAYLCIRKGNTKEGFKKADIIVENTFQTAHQEHLYLEPLGALAFLEPSGEMVVYGSIQCPFYVQKAVARVLGFNLNKVRVVQTVTGGGFGGKEDVPSEICARAALLAYYTKRPVKLILTREEDIITSSKRHPMKMYYKYGITKQGKLIAAEIKLFCDAGAYATLSPIVLYRATVHCTGPYIIPNVKVDSYMVYTNHPPSGAHRGFGQPQVTFACESMMDIAAEKLNIDPLEFRLLNGLEKGTRTATNQLLEESVGLKKTIKEAKKIANWDKKLIQFKKHNLKIISALKNNANYSENSRKLKGIGCASMFYGVSLGAAGWHLDGSGAYLQLHTDGSLTVAIGGAEIGQGTSSLIAQIAAETLGVKLEDVHILPTDTSRVPDSGPTVASRTTVMSGNAVIDAAKQIKANILPIAALCLGTKKTSEVEIKEGYAFLKNNRRKKIHLKVIAEECFKRNINLSAAGWFSAPKSYIDKKTGLGNAYFVYAFGTQIAEVEIDTVTGKVSVLKFFVVQDVGKALNPSFIIQQIEGAIVHGMGYALYEHFKLENGKVLTADCSTYTIPTAMDIPEEITTVLVEEPYSKGPYGAKGVGESPIIPTAAAIANAVSFALNKRIQQLPISAETVFNYIQELRK